MSGSSEAPAVRCHAVRWDEAGVGQHPQHGVRRLGGPLLPVAGPCASTLFLWQLTAWGWSVISDIIAYFLTWEFTNTSVAYSRSPRILWRGPYLQMLTFLLNFSPPEVEPPSSPPLCSIDTASSPAPPPPSPVEHPEQWIKRTNTSSAGHLKQQQRVRGQIPHRVPTAWGRHVGLNSPFDTRSW